MVVTGGKGDTALDKVTSYKFDGTSTDLPSLMVGRHSHGCGSFINSEQKLVKC